MTGSRDPSRAHRPAPEPPEAVPPPEPGGGGLLRPHVPAFVAVVVAQVIGAVAGLAPLLAVVEVGPVLLSPGPVDAGRVRAAVLAGVAGLFVRLLLTGASSALGHVLDGRVQLSLRRRLADRLGRVPLGWLSARRTGELAKVVGEGGALLSGGERQRVSIARALLKDAPVVLLDEVTSALDPVNEAAVQEGVERLMAGRTVVMVAHRLRTVRRADRVVFLDGGRIVEAGGHDELLRRGGRYAGFWNVPAAVPGSKME